MLRRQPAAVDEEPCDAEKLRITSEYFTVILGCIMEMLLF